VTVLGVTLGLLLSQAAPTPALEVRPVVRQGFGYFSSEHVTATGAGGGVGVAATWRDRWLAQADASLLWGGGNVTLGRFAGGAQWRRGAWTPAAWLSTAVLFGDRIETLEADGRRPPSPAWALGLRLSPLRFSGRHGTISVLEAGLGRGPDRGLWLELSVVEVGVRW
jgi:hypothetical protein